MIHPWECGGCHKTYPSHEARDACGNRHEIDRDVEKFITSTADNPLLDCFNSFVGNKFTIDFFHVMDKAHMQFAWAIPDDRSLREIEKYGPIVEIGAGGGYWSWMLRKRGVDVLAYDSHPIKNNWVDGRQWTEVKLGGPVEAKRHSDRTLFLCWPPYDTPMAARCLGHYKGQTVIYIGEGTYGCTGDARFHRMLDRYFTLVNEVRIPQWAGLHDRMFVYERN